MTIRRLNWPLWSGFLLSVVAFLSYPFFFARIPVTRDFPWANLLLFALAMLLLFAGLRRAFASGLLHPTRAKVVGSVVAALGMGVIALFVFSIFVMGRWLPPSSGAPRVGQKAPEFTLADTQGKPVSLAELLTGPVAPNGNTTAAANPNRGVLLVFYRGYW